MSGIPYSFNIILLSLNRLNATDEEKTRLLSTVASSPQAARLYLHFLRHGCQSIDPYGLGLPRATTYRLVKLLEARGLVEKATRRKIGLRGNWKWTWKLVC
jgi:Trm5-related predicted tRNA methylase